MKSLKPAISHGGECCNSHGYKCCGSQFGGVLASGIPVPTINFVTIRILVFFDLSFLGAEVTRNANLIEDVFGFKRRRVVRIEDPLTTILVPFNG